PARGSRGAEGRPREGAFHPGAARCRGQTFHLDCRNVSAPPAVMRLALLALSVSTVAPLFAEPPPVLPAETLLDRSVLRALDEELSGVAAKDHVSRLTQLHRV